MPVSNLQIAKILDEVGTLLEINGESRYRVQAYHNAARTLADLPVSVASMVESGEDLSALPGIGTKIAEKIAEIVETGHLSLLDQLENQLPVQLADLMAVPGLGPKRIKQLYDHLGVTDLHDLAEAVQDQKIRHIPGFGAKVEARIGQELQRRLTTEARIKLSLAEQIAQPLVSFLQECQGVKQVVVAGSYRRRRETIGDLDILITCSQGASVMEKFVTYPDIAQVVVQGDTRAMVILQSGLQVDVRVVAEESYGAALHYFTGSKEHTVAIRKLALQQGLKINEYGVFKDKKQIAGNTEAEVYAQVGLPYITPELRENRGEIEAAQSGKLPRLVSLEDIRGNLHTHTKNSDGRNTLEEMVLAARDRGYEYLAISDHTKHTTVANGQDEKRLLAQIREIDRARKKIDNIIILKSAEVDILEDGSLDMPDTVLKELDVVICSVHYKFDLSAHQQTERVIRAMDNPYFNVFCHPTERLINRREPYAIDMERLMQAALERGCYLEVNSQPDRLDLNDVYCRMAKEMGLKVVISSDAHRISDLDNLRFGIDQARRGWLEPQDVLNTLSWNELKKVLYQRRPAYV